MPSRSAMAETDVAAIRHEGLVVADRLAGDQLVAMRRALAPLLRAEFLAIRVGTMLLFGRLANFQDLAPFCGSKRSHRGSPGKGTGTGEAKAPRMY